MPQDKIAALQSQIAAMRASEQTARRADHILVGRDKTWINLTTAGLLLGAVLLGAITYIEDRNTTETQYRELSGALERLTDAVTAIQSGNGDRQTRTDAMYDCLLNETENPDTFRCPYRRSGDEFVYVHRRAHAPAE